MTIYVGNLSYGADEQALKELFSKFGEVSSAKIIKDNATGRSKGFAFIEMEEETTAKRAIAELNETEFQERTIVVNQARPKTASDRPSGGGFNRNRGGGSSSGGGGFNSRRSY